MARLLPAEQLEQNLRTPSEIEVPARTAWPLVLSFGFTLMFAGLLTNVSVSVLGAVLAIAGSVGWFREVFPHEHEEVVPVIPEDLSVATERRLVERFPLAPEQVRAWLPIETYPISAGVKGGLAGGVAMAVLACLYGLLKAGSIWYPINLLAAVVYAPSEVPSASQFNSGLLYSIMDILDPVLGSHIDWGWFVASQIAFGVVAGVVVLRQSRVRTRENVPFALRAGIEAPGMMPPRGDGEKRP
jgi:hypothetical protein